MRSSDDTNGYVNRSLRSLQIARGIRLLRRRSQTKKRVRSLRVHCSLRSLRLPLCRPLPSSLARRREACLLARSSRTAARQPLSTPVRDPVSTTRSAYFMRLGDWLPATATGAAARGSVNIDEVDAYALIAGQRADHRTESSCGAA